MFTDGDYFRGHEELTSTSSDVVTFFEDGVAVLEIPSAKTDHDALYKCVAENSEGRVVHEANLHIESKS